MKTILALTLLAVAATSAQADAPRPRANGDIIGLLAQASTDDTPVIRPRANGPVAEMSVVPSSIPHRRERQLAAARDAAEPATPIIATMMGPVMTPAGGSDAPAPQFRRNWSMSGR